MTSKETGPEAITAQDLAAFAKEYFSSYIQTIEEKKPATQPKFAQEGPYEISSILLPNGSICMVFKAASELKTHGSSKDWDEVQEHARRMPRLRCRDAQGKVNCHSDDISTSSGVLLCITPA